MHNLCYNEIPVRNMKEEEGAKGGGGGSEGGGLERVRRGFGGYQEE